MSEQAQPEQSVSGKVVQFPASRKHADPCPKCGRLARSFVNGVCHDCAARPWAERDGWWVERSSS